MANRLQRALGFARPSHFWFWLLSSGILAIFSITSLRYLYFDTVFCGGGTDSVGALPGECFYLLRTKLTLLGIKGHLWCILPAGILAGIQFVPAVRRPALLRIHRTIGYASIVLGVTGAMGTLPIIRHSFGGEIAAQAVSGLLLISFVVAQAVGYVSVKQGNVRRHRRWMLRSWIWASAIISMRVVMTLGAIVISFIGGYYIAMPCDKINFTLGSSQKTLQWYPDCSPYFTQGDISRKVVVDADVFGPDPLQTAAAFNLTYGAGAWLAFFFHVVGSELYIQSTGAAMGPGKVTAKSR